MNNVNIDEQSRIILRVQRFLKITGLKINFQHGVDDCHNVFTRTYLWTKYVYFTRKGLK